MEETEHWRHACRKRKDSVVRSSAESKPDGCKHDYRPHYRRISVGSKASSRRRVLWCITDGVDCHVSITIPCGRIPAKVVVRIAVVRGAIVAIIIVAPVIVIGRTIVAVVRWVIVVAYWLRVGYDCYHAIVREQNELTVVHVVAIIAVPVVVPSWQRWWRRKDRVVAPRH